MASRASSYNSSGRLSDTSVGVDEAPSMPPRRQSGAGFGAFEQQQRQQLKRVEVMGLDLSDSDIEEESINDSGLDGGCFKLLPLPLGSLSGEGQHAEEDGDKYQNTKRSQEISNNSMPGLVSFSLDNLGSDVFDTSSAIFQDRNKEDSDQHHKTASVMVTPSDRRWDSPEEIPVRVSPHSSFERQTFTKQQSQLWDRWDASLKRFVTTSSKACNRLKVYLCNPFCSTGLS